MSFVNNKKVALVAAAVVDAMDFVKASKDAVPQSQLEGAKTGMKRHFYIPDPGKVFDGTDATGNIDQVDELEVEATLRSKGTAVELSAWNKLTDLDSKANIDAFTAEIAGPRGTKLAQTIQKEVIGDTIGAALQAVSADITSTPKNGLLAMSEAAGLLQEAAVAGSLSCFNAPSVNNKIAAGSLDNFNHPEKAKELYSEAYIGTYANLDVVGVVGMPQVSTASATAPTLTVTAITEADDEEKIKGWEVVESGSSTKGLPYVLSNCKLVDMNGMDTDNAMVWIAGSKNKVIIKNSAYVPTAGSDEVELTNVHGVAAAAPARGALAIQSGTYKIGQARAKDALYFSTYAFDDLPGSENATKKIGGVSVKMSQYGNGMKLSTLTRLDCPYLACVPQGKQVVNVYYKIA